MPYNFTDIFWQNRLIFASVSFSCIACYYALKYLSETISQEHLVYEKNKSHYIKHNSVVMYSNKHANGWPGWPNNTLDKSLCKSSKIIFEPIIYFIATAEKTLDIAIMMLHINAITEEIVAAKKRGVSVRIICDFEKMNSNPTRLSLEKEKVNVRYYICPEADKCSIFHYKFMVKDWSECSGYASIGSMNWTMSGFYHNFEDIVFTTNKNIVNTLHNEFLESWKYVKNIPIDRYIHFR